MNFKLFRTLFLVFIIPIFLFSQDILQEQELKNKIVDEHLNEQVLVANSYNFV